MSMFKFGSKVGSPPRRPTVLGSDQIPFCTSPSQLQEVTLDQSLSSSISFAALRSPEKTSPMRGRSVKEFEELLSQLKKENFNLKLRIYFLEERLGSMSGTDKEQLTREVVELKVELEALRKEKDEKEDLLLQASRLVELTDKQHQEQLDEKEQQLEKLASKIQQLEAAKEESDLIQFEDSMVALAEERRIQLEKLLEQVRQLEDSLKKEKDRIAEMEEVSQESQQHIQLLQTQCEDYGAQLEEKDSRLSMLSRQLEDKEKQLQAAMQQVDSLMSQTKRSGKSCLSPTKKLHSPEGAEQKTSFRIQELQNAILAAQKENEESKKKIKTLEETNKKSCTAFQSFVKRIKELSQELEKKRVEVWEEKKLNECLSRQLEACQEKFAVTSWMPKQQQQQQPGGDVFPATLCMTEEEKLWVEIENNNQPLGQMMKDQMMTRLELEKQIKNLMESLKQKEHQLSEYETRLAAATSAIQEKDNKISELQVEITDLRKNISSLLEEKRSYDKKMKEEKESEKDGDEEVTSLGDMLKQELEAKNSEIARLNVELKKKNNNLQELVNMELWSKNREIEKLQHRMNSICEKKDVEIMSLQQEVTARDFQVKVLLDKMADLGVHMNLPSALTFRDAFKDLEGKDLDPVSLREQIKSVFEERMYLCHRVGELEEKLRNTPERDDSHLLSMLRGELTKAKEEAARAEAWRCEAVDACALLTKRLEELARFLNSLLSRGCFLGSIGRKRRQLLKQAVENSMELSRTISMSICTSNTSDSQMNSMSSCLTSLSYNVSLADMWDESWLEDGFGDSSCNPDSPTNSRCDISASEVASGDDRNVQLIARLRSEVETLKQELIQRNKEMTQFEKECSETGCEIPLHSAPKCPPTGKEMECDVSFASMTFYNSQHKAGSASQKDNSCVELLKSPRRLSPKSSKNQMVSPQPESCVQLRKLELVNRSNKIRRSSSASAVALGQLQQPADHLDGNVSDSEAWSEPDRNVSFARMGLLEDSSKAASCRSPIRLSFDNSREVESTDSSDDATQSRDATRSPGRQGGRVETELRRLRSRMRGLEQVNESLRSELNVFCCWAAEHTRQNNGQNLAGKIDKSTSIECLADGGVTLQASSQILKQVHHQREKLEALLLHNDAIRHQMEGIMTAMEGSSVTQEAGEDVAKVLENAKIALKRLEVASSRSRHLEEELEKARQIVATQQEQLQEKDNEILEQQCALLEAQNVGQQACIELEQRALELETQLDEARLVAELGQQEQELAQSQVAELERRLHQAIRDLEEANRRMEQMEYTFAEREHAAKAEAERKLSEVEQRTNELKAEMEKQRQEFERRELEALANVKTTREVLKVREEELESRLAECMQASDELEKKLEATLGKVSQMVLQQTRLDNEKVHLEQEVHRCAARETELLKEKRQLEDQVADLQHQLDTQVSTLALQKSELEQEIRQFESVNFELQKNLSKLRHSEIKPYSSNQSEHNSEQVSGLFLDKASSRSSGLDTGDFSSLEYGGSVSQVSLPPRLFRQRSEMSDYVSEDQAADEYGAVISQVCNSKNNVWLTVSSQQLGMSATEQSISRIINSSPDLGIESDAGRLSSMDVAPAFESSGDQRLALQRDYTKLEQENTELKRRLIRTRRTLEETVLQLTVANQRKKQMEKAICKQLCKTHHILKTTRCNLEAASDDYGQSGEEKK